MSYVLADPADEMPSCVSPLGRFKPTSYTINNIAGIGVWRFGWYNRSAWLQCKKEKEKKKKIVKPLAKVSRASLHVSQIQEPTGRIYIHYLHTQKPRLSGKQHLLFYHTGLFRFSPRSASVHWYLHPKLGKYVNTVHDWSVYICPCMS